MWLNLFSNPIAHYLWLTLYRSSLAISSHPQGTSSTHLPKLYTSWTTGQLTPKSCNTITSTKNAANSRNKWPYSEHTSPWTMRPSTDAGSASRQVESHTSCRTCKVDPTSPNAVVSSWANTQEDAHTALGQGSQSDERVMSPPKHAVKLPYWSSEWYCWYHQEVAHYIYISIIDSLISHLPLLCMPQFGSEEELSVSVCPLYHPCDHCL